MTKAKRRYTLRVRGEKLAETRARIVEATMQLHEEVGPRHTTISAIAERAGVERLTVYRHFPDEASVFAACSRHHAERNPLPDPAAWAGEADPRVRTRRALGALYAHFGRTARMLDKIHRDTPDYPALRAIMAEVDAYLRQYADDLAATWPRGAGSTRRATTLRHATKFSTWQSLEADGIADDAKISLILAWIDPS